MTIDLNNINFKLDKYNTIIDNHQKNSNEKIQEQDSLITQLIENSIQFYLKPVDVDPTYKDILDNLKTLDNEIEVKRQFISTQNEKLDEYNYRFPDANDAEVLENLKAEIEHNSDLLEDLTFRKKEREREKEDWEKKNYIGIFLQLNDSNKNKLTELKISNPEMFEKIKTKLEEKISYDTDKIVYLTILNPNEKETLVNTFNELNEDLSPHIVINPQDYIPMTNTLLFKDNILCKLRTIKITEEFLTYKQGDLLVYSTDKYIVGKLSNSNGNITVTNIIQIDEVKFSELQSNNLVNTLYYDNSITLKLIEQFNLHKIKL